MSLTSRKIELQGAVLIVPRSNATNVYDLLMDVARAIEEEPRRYNQEDWHARVAPCEVYEATTESGPSCGTVACRAGWIVELAGHWDSDPDPAIVWWGGGIAGAARQILGVTWGGLTDEEREEDAAFGRDVADLFDGSALCDLDNQVAIGTPEYAAAGAAGVREFAEKWKERLLATPVRRKEQVAR